MFPSLGNCFSADALCIGKYFRSLLHEDENVVTFPNPASAQCFEDIIEKGKKMVQVVKRLIVQA